MLGGIFGSKDSSQGKSPAILGIVGDSDAVGFGVVADAVDARYFSFADRGDRKFIRGAIVGSANGSVRCNFG